MFWVHNILILYRYYLLRVHILTYFDTFLPIFPRLSAVNSCRIVTRRTVVYVIIILQKKKLCTVRFLNVQLRPSLGRYTLMCRLRVDKRKKKLFKLNEWCSDFRKLKEFLVFLVVARSYESNKIVQVDLSNSFSYTFRCFRNALEKSYSRFNQWRY